MHAVALLWLNRIEEATACQAAPSAWIDGLEKSIALPHALAIAQAIETRFSPLNGEDGERLRELRSRLPNN
jgi:hypothetical protein